MYGWIRSFTVVVAIVSPVSTDFETWKTEIIERRPITDDSLLSEATTHFLHVALAMSFKYSPILSKERICSPPSPRNTRRSFTQARSLSTHHGKRFISFSALIPRASPACSPPPSPSSSERERGQVHLLSQPRELASPPLPAGGLSGHRRGSRRVLAGRSPLAVAARGAAAAQLLGAVYRAPVHQVTLSLVTDDQSHLLRR